MLDEKRNPVQCFNKHNPLSIFGQINETLFYMPTKIIFRKNGVWNYTNKPMKVRDVSGAAFMIRKQIFDEIKGFDPGFFMYWEDVDFSERTQKAKYNNMSIPYAEIIHFGGKSSVNDFKTEQMMKGRHLCIKKHCNSIQRIIMNSIALTNIASRLIICMIINNKDKIKSLKKIIRLFISTEKLL
jgi:GT2 family glycosyltransferase